MLSGSLTPEQLAFYDREGYLVLEQLLRDADLRPAREAMARKEPLPLPVRKGDVILFNDRCIHSSTPNRSDHVRWAIDLRYQPTSQDPMLTIGRRLPRAQPQAPGAGRHPGGPARGTPGAAPVPTGRPVRGVARRYGAHRHRGAAPG